MSALTHFRGVHRIGALVHPSIGQYRSQRAPQSQQQQQQQQQQWQTPLFRFPQRLHAVAFASYAYPAPVEHAYAQPEGVVLSPIAPNSPSWHQSERAEGEPFVPVTPSAARRRQPNRFLAILFSRAYDRSRRFLMKAAGAVACVIAVTAASDEPGAAAASVAQAQASAAAAAHDAAKAGHSQANWIPSARSPFFEPHRPMLPDLGPFQPAAPFLEFGLAAMAGYAAGSTARVLTRVGVLLVGASALGLYFLQRHGLIELKFNRIKSLGRQLVAENQERAQAALDAHPSIVAKIIELAETLTTTAVGIAFSGGFLFALK